MASLQMIVEHLDSILDPAAYDDYGPNGLQVPGREDVETIVTGVSANVDLFTRALG
jgi:putative NIF3 family GTP cyclohydrolase 1 type 2